MADPDIVADHRVGQALEGGLVALDRRRIEAGIELFGTRGYANTPVKAICEEAGLTERYFYEAFDDREDLLDEIFTAVFSGGILLAGVPLLRVFNTDVAVSITGIAGPGGGMPGKPVGLTYLAVATRSGWLHVENHVWPGDREAVKQSSADCALKLILRATERG